MEKLSNRLPEQEKAHLHNDFLENEESYWRVRESLLSQHRGKWVAVRAGQVVAEADDVLTILDLAANLEGHPYIARVGDEGREFTIRSVFLYDRGYQPFPLPRVRARFSGSDGGGLTLEDVIPDTGADLSLLPGRDGDAIGLRASPYLTITVRGIIGPSVTAVVYRGFVEIGGHSCRSLIQLVNGVERILGRDVLNQLRVTFDGPRGRVEIGEKTSEAQL